MRRIAIVGAGPSGCFTAQGLLKSRPGWQVDLIESLPVPYGLVRYGVAADHQGTKAIARQFERLFERQGAGFYGNVTLGRDVTLAALRGAYDAVVLAAGLSGDRVPDIGLDPAQVQGVTGAGALTRALYDHPDATALPDLGGHVVILGNGNVAIDLLRLLAKSPAELEGSDLGQAATDWLATRKINSLTIVGRSAAAEAKFDTVMIKELARLAAVTLRVADLPAQVEGHKGLTALAEIDGLATGTRPVTFRFGLTPQAVVTEAGQIRALRFASASGSEELSCDALITAIGFQSTGNLDRDALIAGAEAAGDGKIATGLYVAGWFRRGPRGTIADNRSDGMALATRIIADLETAPQAERAGRTELAALLAADHPVVRYPDWQRIDAGEVAQAMPGRCRTKFTTRADMLRLARALEEVK
jgi:ferredoxin/flavodoxin---NADP+ reductase